jgi:hypothetical protein
LQQRPVVPHCTSVICAPQQSAVVWHSEPSGAQAQRPALHTPLQHSVLPPHSVPMFLQHALFALQRMPLQQSSTLVQVAPDGAQHSEASHSRPGQQSPAAAHARFTLWQQRPAVPHVADEQQGVPAVQVVPSGAQHWPVRQLPVQHSVVAVQLAATSRHGPQRPLSQMPLPQQSPWDAQLAPS